jgi:hypothetical protein
MGPIIGGMVADWSGSYHVPFYWTSATLFLSIAAVWFFVQEEFTKPQKGSRRGSLLGSLVALARSPALLALFFVLLMAQFSVKTVQPMVTLYVKGMVGDLPSIATLAGIAFRSPASPTSSPLPFSAAAAIGSVIAGCSFLSSKPANRMHGGPRGPKIPGLE